MPIRWSAYALSQKLDEIEGLLDQLDPILDECKAKAEETKAIPHLPGYITEKLDFLRWDVERFREMLRRRVKVLRDNIPSEALKREEHRQQLLLELGLKEEI